MLRLPLILLLLALAACATPKGPWHVVGADDATTREAEAILEAAKRVTPDEHGWLAMGGTVQVAANVNDSCAVTPPYQAAGCSYPGSIWLLWPHPKCAPGSDLTCSALAHEACHLGLERGGGFFGGPVIIPGEAEADACALLVNLEYRRSLP